MKCVYCDEEMKCKIISYDSKWGKYEVTLKGITAFECIQCNRLVFEPDEARMIQNITAGLADNDKPEGQKPDVLNVEEVAELLRVSNQTIYNMIKDGRLNASKVGREWRFPKSQIMGLMEIKSLAVAARGEMTSKDLMFIREKSKKGNS